MAQMKEEIKAPTKMQLSDEGLANLPEAQFQMLVVVMLSNWLSMVTT